MKFTGHYSLRKLVGYFFPIIVVHDDLGLFGKRFLIMLFVFFWKYVWMKKYVKIRVIYIYIYY